MEPGISLSVSFGNRYDSHHDHWMFVRERDFERHDLNRYSVNRAENINIIRNSTVINTTYIDNRHTIYVAGPLVEDVQKVVGRRINPVSIAENNRPGKDLNNGELRIYRPMVERTSANQRKPAPVRITTINDVKQPSVRNRTYQPDNVRPQNNSDIQPTHPQNVNPANNLERQQPSNEKPQNTEGRTQPPKQPETSFPTGHDGRGQQPAAKSPQKNNTQVQPAQPHSATPTRVQQTSTSKPQNASTARPAHSSPAVNDPKQQQHNSTNPQNPKSNEQPKESRKEKEK
jgi:hypothetical protein